MDVVVGGSRPRRNVTDHADGPRTQASKLLRSTGSTGVTQCRPTNTSARLVTSASKPSRSSLTRPSPRALNAVANFAKSSPLWASSSRVRASTRTTVEALQSRRRPPRARRRPLLRRRPTPARLRRPRRQPPRHRRRRRPRPRTRYLQLRCFQSRRSDRRHYPATIRGRSRRRPRRATCAATLTPR
jgi:hypothetical protein